jgi:hypothetical protein
MASICSVTAQGTIGSGIAPDPGALLQLNQGLNNPDGSNSEKGFELPRVALTSKTDLYPMFPAGYPGTSKTAEDAKHTGLTVYNMATESTQGFEPGIYVWNGQEWTSVKGGGDTATLPAERKFFYMPSFNLPDNGSGGLQAFDLYGEYKRQFTKIGNPNFVNNNLTDVPGGMYEKNELDFVVTDYDKSVLNVANIINGVMYYTVSSKPTINSYINVIISVK